MHNYIEQDLQVKNTCKGKNNHTIHPRGGKNNCENPEPLDRLQL